MHQQRLLYTICFFLTVTALQAQDRLQLFDKEWIPTSNRDSVKYFVQINHLNDTTHVCKFYNAFGPMIRQETFKDSMFTVPHGLWVWYSEGGDADSLGIMKEGNRHGSWVFGYDKKYTPLHVRVYNAGELIITKPFQSDNSKVSDSTLVTPLYPGGVKKWTQYLVDGMEKAKRFKQIKRGDNYDMAMSIEIDPDGWIKDVVIIRSGDIYSDTNAEQIVRNSKQWKPALRLGTPVNFFYFQKLSIR